MTAVLSQPSLPNGLLDRRRLSNAQFGDRGMEQFMAEYHMSLKSGLEPMSEATHMSRSHFMPSQPQPSHLGMEAMSLDINTNALSSTGLVPGTMPYSDSTIAVDTTHFTNPYNLATSFTASMPTLAQMNHMSSWQSYSNMPVVPMASTHIRSDSLTSLETCTPMIKSEESPIQPSQVFYDTPPYSSQGELSSPTSSDDSKATNFSTDVDTLMKAIQSKGKNAEQPRDKVFE